MTESTGNNLLNALKISDFDLIKPRLKEVYHKSGATIYEPGDHVELVYFPCESAMAGFFIGLPDGKGVETALIGREGAIGGIVSQGRLPAYARCTVQYSGTFLVMGSKALEELKMQSLTIRHLFARYADCLMAQIFQTTACNAGHTINQRAAKWMMATVERSGTYTIEMTQDQLAQMLGIGRSYISRVIGTMKSEDIIAVSRRKIEIRDPVRIKAMACDCNENVKDHFDRVLRGVYPDDAD
ncbi:MAG: Crp/Fnr family transcriptional regulator [Novosphingobium sp.]